MTRIFLAALMTVVFGLCIPAGGAAAPPPGELFAFAEALYGEADYYRAITEYKRLLHFHPHASLAPAAALRIGEAYLEGERWEEAERSLDEVPERYPDSPQAERARFLLGRSAFARGDYLLATRRDRAFVAGTADPQLAKQARWRLFWGEVEQFNLGEARQQLGELEAPPGLTEELGDLERLPTRSPRVAGTLSALLPGAGQLYTGRVREAGLALALNAAFIAAALEAFDNGNEVVGGLLLFFEAGWYGGNIFNAVSGAHKFNREQRRQGVERLRRNYAMLLSMQDDAPVVILARRF